MLLLLVLAPLPQGGDAPWLRPYLGLSLAVLWGLWVLETYLRGEVRYWPSWTHVFCCGVAGLTLCQLLPLPHWADGLSPVAGGRWEEARQLGLALGRGTLSLVPAASREGLELALMAFVTFFLATHSFTRRRGLIVLALAVVTAATLNAIIGLADGADGGPKIYAYLGTSDGVTGTFLSRNHLALLLEMGLGVAVGLGLATAFARPGGSGGHPADTLGETLKRHRTVCLLAIALPVMILVVALLFNFSRAGVSCALVAVGALSCCAYRATGKSWTVSLVFAGIVLGLFLAGTQGLAQVWRRFEVEFTGESLSGLVRLDIWKSSLALLSDYWLCGVGQGAYAYVSPLYESGVIPDRIAMRAHNDWLEFLCEFGVPAGLLLLGLLVAGLAATAVRLHRRQDPVLKWLGAGAWFALLAVALHESLDYGLRKPGNLLVCMGVLALATACSRVATESPGAERPPAWRKIRLGRMSGLAFLLLGLALPLLAVRALWPALLAGRALTRLEARTSPEASDTHLRSEDETRARSELARQVLRYLPHQSQALLQHAESQARLSTQELQQNLAQGLTRELGYEVRPDDLEAPELLIPQFAVRQKLPVTVLRPLADRLQRAVTDLRHACAQEPTQGYSLALYAGALERWGTFTGQVDEAAVHRAFAQAHRLYPNVGRVTSLCADGAWRAFLRLRFTEHAAQAARRRQDALRLFRGSLRQSPDYAPSVYPTLWTQTPSRQLLRELTPDYPGAHEALYQFLLAQRDFGGCLEQLDTLERFRRARTATHAAGQPQPLYDLVRWDPRPPEPLALSVARRRVLLLGLLERWDDRHRALADLQCRRDTELDASLRLAETLLADDDTSRAQALLTKLLEAQPGQPRALVLMARTLEQSGQTDAATRVLLPLVYSDEPLDAQLLDELLSRLQPPPPSPLRATEAPPFPVWRFLHAGLLLKRATSPPAGPAPVFNPAANPAPGAQAPTPVLHRQGDIREALQELQFLLAMMTDTSDPTWIQTPMLHYLIGRAHECLKEDRDALRAYARALRLCPTHLPAAQAAARLLAGEPPENRLRPPAEGPSEEPELCQVLARAGLWLAGLHPDVPLAADFGGKIRLLGYTFEPRQLLPNRVTKATFYWYCLTDIEREYLITCRYSQDPQHVFADDYTIRDNGSNMVAWRVGEVMTVTRELLPLRLLAPPRRPQITPGWYDVTLVPYAGGVKAHLLPAAVECRGRAFEILTDD